MLGLFAFFYFLSLILLWGGMPREKYPLSQLVGWRRLLLHGLLLTPFLIAMGWIVSDFMGPNPQ